MSLAFFWGVMGLSSHVHDWKFCCLVFLLVWAILVWTIALDVTEENTLKGRCSSAQLLSLTRALN